MNKALVIIDYTNDFVAPYGALTCGEPAQDIEENIVKIYKQFMAEEQYIVIANDIHYRDDEGYHPETNLFPPHNLAMSEGRELYGKVGKIWEESHYQKTHHIEKTRYSAFAGTDLEIRLRERGINEVHLVGVCTDICVLHTAVDAYNKGFKIVIHGLAVASFNREGHAWALNHFRTALGAEVLG